jgi:Fe-S-cluster containining protein
MLDSNGRDDILEWVDPIQLGDNERIYDIWISPVTHDDVSRCPWLVKLPNQQKYICRVHDVKPEHCRKYPRSTKHAQKTGCRGLMTEVQVGSDQLNSIQVKAGKGGYNYKG